MKCNLATTKFRGREWKVWFTEEIPVSLGPWKLGGLPGLILKADADDDFIKFTAVSIRTEGLSPVTFYNWAGSKYYKMDRIYRKGGTGKTVYRVGVIGNEATPYYNNIQPTPADGNGTDADNGNGHRCQR